MLECGCTYRAIRGKRLGNYELIEQCPEHMDPETAATTTTRARTTLPVGRRSLPGSAFYRR